MGYYEDNYTCTAITVGHITSRFGPDHKTFVADCDPGFVGWILLVGAAFEHSPGGGIVYDVDDRTSGRA